MARTNETSIMKYISTAISLEEEGLRFYTNALKRVDDPNSRGLLKFLVAEEKVHLDYFVGLSKRVATDSARKLVKRHRIPLFKKRDYRRMKSEKTATINVFNVALEMEERGIRFYATAAKSVRDPKIKKFLLSLAGMEKRHFRLIKEHQDAIYDAWYWDAVEMPALNT